MLVCGYILDAAETSRGLLTQLVAVKRTIGYRNSIPRQLAGREAALLRTLTHRNIVDFVDVGESVTAACLVMRLCASGNLHAFIQLLP